MAEWRRFLTGKASLRAAGIAVAAGLAGAIYVTLDEYRQKMFSPDVTFSVTALDVVGLDPITRKVTAQLTGSGFMSGTDVYVNGVQIPAGNVTVVTPGVMVVEFNPPNRDTWNVTVVKGPPDERVSATLSLPNQVALRVLRSEVIRYEPAVKDKPKSGLIIARVQGIGFSSRLVVTARRATGPAALVYTVVSQNEIIIEIKAPNEIEIVNLRDPITGASTGTTIVRPPSGS